MLCLRVFLYKIEECLLVSFPDSDWEYEATNVPSHSGISWLAYLILLGFFSGATSVSRVVIQNTATINGIFFTLSNHALSVTMHKSHS